MKRVVFYKQAIPADFSGGFYDSPIVCVNIRGEITRAEALEHARKLFKEQMGSMPEEWGVTQRFE